MQYCLDDVILEKSETYFCNMIYIYCLESIPLQIFIKAKDLFELHACLPFIISQSGLQYGNYDCESCLLMICMFGPGISGLQCLLNICGNYVAESSISKQLLGIWYDPQPWLAACLWEGHSTSNHALASWRIRRISRAWKNVNFLGSLSKFPVGHSGRKSPLYDVTKGICFLENVAL